MKIQLLSHIVTFQVLAAPVAVAVVDGDTEHRLRCRSPSDRTPLV